jgi:pimeloyl-ACP methyl ester carboxylesterase
MNSLLGAVRNKEQVNCIMELRKRTVSRGTFNIRDRSNKEGIPLVMIHGWPETSYCWEAVTQFLNSNLRVIAPDLRGMGDSERTIEQKYYQKIELAQDIIEIINSFEFENVFLVGHDWGGVIAQEVALAIPARVRKLALMNTPVINNFKGNAEALKVMQSQGSVPHWYQYFQQQRGLAEAMIAGNESVWIRYFFGKAGKQGRISRETIEEYIRCNAIKDTPLTGAGYYRTMIQDGKRWTELAGTEFPMPSLYIYGNKDIVIVREYLNHIEECFNNIRVVELEAEHFLHEEKAETVAEILNDFISV